MSLSNIMRLSAVLPVLTPRLGWTIPTEAGYGFVDCDNNKSTTGMYFDDDIVHPAVSIKNIMDTQKDPKLIDDPVKANKYLRQITNSVWISVLEDIFTEPQTIENAVLYKRYDNTEKRIEKNSGKYRGLFFDICEGDFSVIINSVVLMFDKDVQFKLNLFHEDAGKIHSWTVNCKANKPTKLNLGQLLSSEPSYSLGGKYFLAYDETDLNGANPVRIESYQHEYTIVNVGTFEAKRLGEYDFEMQNYSEVFDMVGINADITCAYDLTNSVLQNAHVLDKLVKLTMASKVIDIIINSPRSNATERITRELMNKYNSENNLVTTSEMPYMSGLKSEIKKELEKVRKSFKRVYKTQIANL